MATTSAVTVQNACKSYGKNEVLKSICMQVSRGSIYGLLGASGCGKTTLLGCIVGQKRLNSGDIWVLGGKPGTPGSGVPGPKIGYMPQDIALVGEFTIQDAIYYFGRICDMSERKIQERFDELSNVLDLPPKNRYIKNCSGGQQRRVSFAASMVHTPELLILDEPTVGVDPLLRDRIWNYLVDGTAKTGMAVIITTHYIEEARQANMIGLMRGGRLLTEESPTNLLNMYQTELLEDVFLILSQSQNEGALDEPQPTTNNMQVQYSHTDSILSLNTTSGSTELLQKKKITKPVGGYSLNSRRLKALLDKNCKQLYRNISGMIFIFLFPVLQAVVFLLAIGADAKDLSLAIVNEESISILCQNFTMESSAVPYGFTGCHFYNISCRFLTYLEHPMIHKVHYDRLSEALDHVRHGQVVGVLYMAENFTESFEKRLEQGRNVEKDVLSASEIKVWLDMSNRQIGLLLQYKLFKLFKNFQKDLVRDCKYNAKAADFVKLETFYDKDDDVFTKYMTPGLVVTSMFFLMALMTSQIIITDRVEGVWDRSIIAGVSAFEISLTHFLIQTCIAVLYTTVILVITFPMFQIENVGSMWILVIITFLQGLAGMSFGFSISIISVNITMSIFLTLGSFYLTILLNGGIWPLEGMPIGLQWISRSLPFTVPVDSFRNVMEKGWALNNFQVLNGIAIEVFWIILLSIANTILIKTKG